MAHCPTTALRSSLLLLACLTLALVSTAHARQGPQTTSWLEQPLAGWNSAGARLPKAPSRDEGRHALVQRCGFESDRATVAQRALADAGWIPLPHLTRELIKDDMEIVDGVVAASDHCEPTEFNSFVFVGGMFAGTLSPTVMASRRDGDAGAIRIVSADTVTVDFSRYQATDTECCPSSHVKARFRITRVNGLPVIEPVDLQTTR